MASSTRNATRASMRRDPVTRMHHDALLTPTTLPRAPDAAGPSTQTDSSTSDSDLEPLRPPDARPRHSRSMSNPFPSLFNSKKKRNESAGPPPPPNLELECSQGPMAGQGFRKHKRGSLTGSKDFATGHCMTCASLVKWPQELKVFKCTICTTINDLAPTEPDARKARPASRRPDTNQESASLSIRAVPPPRSSFELSPHNPSTSSQPVSVQHSKRLIRQCLQSFLIKRLGARPTSNSKTHPDLSSWLIDGDQSHSSADNMGYARSPAADHRRTTSNPPSEYQPKYVFDQEPTLHPNRARLNTTTTTRSYSSLRPETPLLQPTASVNPSNSSRRDVPAGRKEDYKKTFKPMADYIVACLGSFACVNASFMSRPKQSAHHGTDFSIRRKPVPSREPPNRRPPEPPQEASQNREATQSESFLNGLDPKMLLLGDFAENGMWWTGGQENVVMTAANSANRSESASKASELLKSPELNWQELGDWYTTVINAAQGWFEVYDELSRDANFASMTEADLEAVEAELLQAQSQLQRVLLKATELLLKRPGRPLTTPLDLRFLLIILENPLLHPGTHVFHGLLQSEEAHTPSAEESSPTETSMPATGPLSGQHSGIIKRIIGLLSKSSAECHNQLIYWFSKFPNAHFTRTKDLVAGFLTYRLLRQSAKTRPAQVDITAGLIPEMQAGRSLGAYLHDEIGSGQPKKAKEPDKSIMYADDWQIKASARVLALLFAANNLRIARQGGDGLSRPSESSTTLRDDVLACDQWLPTSDFYNLVIDNIDLVGDFESWETRRSKFAFCHYPFLLSIWAKTQILEHDARRQMQNKARDAFFDSVMTRRNIKQYLSLEVRRDCLVDDSLKAVGEVIGSGSEDVKKALRITFRGEEGIDGGGLRKEWFLLLIREVFNPEHGLFLYDEDSRACYFNPNSFETSDQFFLVGVVMGLAIYNSTILDVALPPFAFRKLLASAPTRAQGPTAHPKPALKYTLDDLAEYKPRLARGLKQLLEFDGDVEETFALDFVIDVERYGTSVRAPLCSGGEQKPVNNDNRREYVDLYVRHVLDTAIVRQFEPFKRGFYTVCGGNAFSLFRAEEIELLVRGSDAELDIDALRAVAEYDGWESRQPDGQAPVVGWFWNTFAKATPTEQRRLLLFITGSDRIPAMGAAMLTIKISCLGEDCGRFPIARTCFNLLSLWRYKTRQRLEAMLWRAVHESEGFGLK
ncbi:hypothetical protein HIM_00251 [Hirsutella minnesotensis 3608]|nr:hypothetical protein HIM_00251 [Hirsutella minnesotensis 3608]